MESVIFAPDCHEPTASWLVAVAAMMLPSAASVAFFAKKTPVPSLTVAHPPMIALTPDPTALVVSVVIPLLADWIPAGSSNLMVPSLLNAARVKALRFRTAPPAPAFTTILFAPPEPRVVDATVCEVAAAFPVIVSVPPLKSRPVKARNLSLFCVV